MQLCVMDNRALLLQSWIGGGAYHLPAEHQQHQRPCGVNPNEVIQGVHLALLSQILYLFSGRPYTFVDDLQYQSTLSFRSNIMLVF